MRQYVCAKKLQSQAVTKEKLQKAFLYVKVTSKMLMKLKHELHPGWKLYLTKLIQVKKIRFQAKQLEIHKSVNLVDVI